MIEPEKRRKYLDMARRANKEGRPLKVNDVIHQILEISNNNIGAAKVYWSDIDYGRPMEGWEDETPNSIRDKFVEKINRVYEKYVEKAVILHPEKRKAMDLFKIFLDHTAVVDWDNQTEFEEVSKEYNLCHDLVLEVGTAPEKRMQKINQRKYDLQKKLSLLSLDNAV